MTVNHSELDGRLPAQHLTGLLAAGPRDSRDVLSALAAVGVSPKQARTARERLGVVVQRSGSGTHMRSRWSLPTLAKPNTVAAQPVTGAAPMDCQKTNKTQQELDAGIQGTNHPSAVFVPELDADLAATDSAMERVLDRHEHLQVTDAEHSRLMARIDAFKAHGVAPDLAADVARALVLVDRDNRPGVGSCLQCQSFHRATCPVVPRAPVEVHLCLYSRRATP